MISFFYSQICVGQKPQKSILFEELIDQYCSEILALELDLFITELNKLPDSKAYVLFYGKNSQEGKNLLYSKVPQKYLVNSRGFSDDRIITLRGENKDKMVIQFWIVPSGSEPPTIGKNFVKEKINSTTLFDKSWTDWHKWNGTEWTIYSFSFAEWGCEMDVNMKAFAESLHSQPDLTGYLVVYTKFGKGKNQAKKVIDFAVKDLTRQHKVPLEKLKTIYGGNRTEPELELWLVPNGNKPPTPNPDKFDKN